MISRYLIVTSAVLLATNLASGIVKAEDEYGPLKKNKTAAGDVLATPDGMTIYTFDKDEKGVSNCNGDCAKIWPPVLAEETAKPTGDLTLVKRQDGKMQWADEGR